MIDFIHPLYLFLIAAAAAPLIIHLMQRHRARVVGFSSVDLLMGAERRTVRWIRLRQVLLLLLRTLIILLLVLGLAHPLIRGPVRGGIETHLPTSVVMIVDNSLSMGWTKGGRSLLDRSLDRARRVLGEMNDDDRCVLLTVPSPAEEPLKIEGREAILRALDGMRPIPARLDLSALIVRAMAQLMKMPGPGREVHVYTDLQATAFEAPKGTGEKVDGGDPGRNEDVRLIFLTERQREAWNRAITAITLEDAPISPDRTAYLEIKVVEEGSPSATGKIFVRVDLEDGEDYIREVSLDGRGQGTLRVPIRGPSSETVRGRVEIDPDPLDADNRRSFTVQLPGRPRVWYVTGNVTPSPLGTALGMLDREVGSIELKRGLPDTDLEYRDVIVLDSPAPEMVEAAVSLFSRGLGDAAVVVLPPRSDAAAGRLNGLLDLLGLPDRYLGTVGSGGENYLRVRGGSSMTGGLDRFVRAYGEALSDVHFFRYVSMYGGGPISGAGAETIDFDTGAPWIVMKGCERSRRVLFSSGFGERWSDLYRRPLFVPFVDTLLRDVISRGRLLFADFAPGDRVVIDLPAVGEGTEVDLVGPGGEKRRLFTAGGRVEFRAPAAAGNYRLEVPGRQVAGFSVNPDGRESALEEGSEEMLRRAGAGLMPTVVRAGAGLEEAVLMERPGRDLWWEALCLAILLLVVEGFAANWGRV